MLLQTDIFNLNPVFRAKDNDFRSHSLMDFASLGYKLDPDFIKEILKPPVKFTEGGNHTTYEDITVVSGVEYVKPDNFDNVPNIGIDDYLKMFVNTLVERTTELGKEECLFFLSGGIDSICILLLLLNCDIPFKPIVAPEKMQQEEQIVIKYLQGRYNLDIDFVDEFEPDEDMVDLYTSVNPPLHPIGWAAEFKTLQIIQKYYPDYTRIADGKYIESICLQRDHHFYKGIHSAEQMEIENEKHGWYYKPKFNTVDYQQTHAIGERAMNIKRIRNIRYNGLLSRITGKTFLNIFLQKELFEYALTLDDHARTLCAYKYPQRSLIEELDVKFDISLLGQFSTPWAKSPSENIRHRNYFIHNWIKQYAKNLKN